MSTKHKGSAILAAVLVLSITSSLLAVSVAKATQAGMSSSSASKVSLQAQQYAAAEGDIMRMTAYSDLAGKAKSEISGTAFSKEVSVGTESDYTDTIKKKIVTIKIYKGNDSLPCATLDIPRLNADVDGKGVPIGTVITWASNNAPTENGVWLECNGQSCAAYPELTRVLGRSTVPDYRGRFLETDTVAGTIKEAALPNIVGHTCTYDNGSVGSGMNLFDTGAFYETHELWYHVYSKDYSKSISIDSTGSALTDIQSFYNKAISLGYKDYLADAEVGSNFDASRCSSIYQDGITTVQPAAVTVRRFIRAA